MDLIKDEPRDALLAPRMFSYTDDDSDIYGVSETAGRSIKQIVFAFISHHHLPYGAWRIKAYGLPGSDLIDVWITALGVGPGSSRCGTQMPRTDLAQSLLTYQSSDS